MVLFFFFFFFCLFLGVGGDCVDWLVLLLQFIIQGRCLMELSSTRAVIGGSRSSSSLAKVIDSLSNAQNFGLCVLHLNVSSQTSCFRLSLVVLNHY
jgi:hypothetical protein